MLCSFKGSIRSLFSSESGVALIEFAYCITLLMLLLWGGIEIARYVLIVQRLEDAASQQTNIITTIDPMHATMTAAEMDSILQSATLMMDPYPFVLDGTNNLLIVTDIYAPLPAPGKIPVGVVQWRYCAPGAATSATQTRSKLGAIGKPANLSIFPGFSMGGGDEIIVAEIYYKFSPVVTNAITAGLLPVNKPVYIQSMSVPRFGLLTNLAGTPALPSNCP